MASSVADVLHQLLARLQVVKEPLQSQASLPSRPPVVPTLLVSSPEGEEVPVSPVAGTAPSTQAQPDEDREEACGSSAGEEREQECPSSTDEHAVSNVDVHEDGVHGDGVHGDGGQGDGSQGDGGQGDGGQGVGVHGDGVRGDSVSEDVPPPAEGNTEQLREELSDELGSSSPWRRAPSYERLEHISLPTIAEAPQPSSPEPHFLHNSYSSADLGQGGRRALTLSMSGDTFEESSTHSKCSGLTLTPATNSTHLHRHGR